MRRTVAARRPRQECSSQDDAGLAGIKDEGRVGQALVRHFMEAAFPGAQVEPLRMKFGVDRVSTWFAAMESRGPSVDEPVVVCSPTLGAWPVACGQSRRLVKEEQFRVATRRHQRRAAAITKIHATSDPALARVAAANRPGVVVKAASVPEDESSFGARYEISQRRHAVLAGHDFTVTNSG
jgi:hypothetical protein